MCLFENQQIFFTDVKPDNIVFLRRKSAVILRKLKANIVNREETVCKNIQAWVTIITQ